MEQRLLSPVYPELAMEASLVDQPDICDLNDRSRRNTRYSLPKAEKVRHHGSGNRLGNGSDP